MDVTTNVWVQVLTNVQDYAQGLEHSYVIRLDDTLRTTGRNNYGQLGKGDENDTNKWTQVLTDVKCVTAGSYFGLAIRNDGTLWGTGNNYLGI